VNSSPALPFITAGVGEVRVVLPALLRCAVCADYRHEGCVTAPSKGNQKLGLGGDKVAWMWVAKNWMVGAHLSNTSRITSLLLLSPLSKMCHA